MILSILLPIAQLAAEVTDILQIIDDIEYITQKHKEGVDKLDTRLLQTLSIESVKYNKGETLVCHIENENLTIKRREIFKKSDSEEHNISMTVDHKNVVKTFLILQAKKGDMRIEYSISPYYEEEVKMNMFKSPKDLLDYLKQLGTGISHLHGKNIKHGDIKIENTRLTYYNKTITAEQREFIVQSFDTLHEKTVKRPKGDSVNKTEADDECNPNKPGNMQSEENKNGLVWLNAYKNETLLNLALSIEKIQKNNEPTYVLIDLDESMYFDDDKLLVDLTKQITKLKVEIHKYELLETFWGAELVEKAKELGIVNGSETVPESEELEIWNMIFMQRESNRWREIKDNVKAYYGKILYYYKLRDDLKEFKWWYDCKNGDMRHHLETELAKIIGSSNDLRLKAIWITLLELELSKNSKTKVEIEDVSNDEELRSFRTAEKNRLNCNVDEYFFSNEIIDYEKVTKSEAMEIFKILKVCQMFKDDEKLRELEKIERWTILKEQKKSFWLEMWKILEDVTRSIAIKKLARSRIPEKRNELIIMDVNAGLSNRRNETKRFTQNDINNFANTFCKCSMQYMLINIDNILSNKSAMFFTENFNKIFGDHKDPVDKILSQCNEIDVNQMTTMDYMIKNFPTEDEYKRYLQQLAASKKNVIKKL